MKHYPFVKFGFTMFSKDELVYMLSSNEFKVTNIVEKQEPPQKIHETTIPVATLIVSAVK